MKTLRYVRFDTDGTRTWYERDVEDTLAFMQGEVGGYIERVEIRPGDQPPFDMWLNEEGLIIGLPVNPVASLLAGTVLVGPAICLAGDDEGETVSLPDTTAALLTGQSEPFDWDAAPWAESK